MERKRWGGVAAKALAAAALLGIGGVLAWAGFGAGRPVQMGEVVFFGDSITEYCDLAAYYPGLDTVNQGIAGDTTDGMLRRLEQVYAAGPQIVVILGGVNDILSGYDAEHVLNNLSAIVRSIHERLPQARVVVQSIYPVAEGDDLCFTRQIRDVNARLEEQAAELDYRYTNVYDVLCTEDGRLDRLYSDDGLHPNDAGYRIACPLVRAAVEKAAGGA